MRSLALLALTLLTFPAAAAETAWQEIAPGVRLRMISSDVLAADRTTTVALQLDMPQGTKTYWRIPGESGIATEIDTGGSSGVAGHEILWPYPRIEVVGGLTDFVYRGPTVLPVRLQLDGERADLRASVVMGICSDVCVPAMASFTLPLDFAKPDRGQGLRIAQAEALAPRAWSGPHPPFGAVSWNPAAEGISVAMSDPTVDPLTLIADASSSGQVFGAPQKSPDGSTILLPLLGGAAETAVEGKPISFTFMTDTGPFSLSTTVVGGSTAAAP